MDGSSLGRNQFEVFIVDNASADGSLEFLIPLFPGFHFIQNNENTGFAKANNRGLVHCTGEFVLFLNPDTILSEDCLDSCLSFFRSTPDAGALGVRMIDGSGNYLKESKRGFPSPWASFFKMSGMARLFPHSKIFSAYYMGHLQEGSPQAVDILSGAYMMVRKTILDKTGGFDEQFFMYGEDIDLSFRISRYGHRNYYLPAAMIIHFKGESTRKDDRYIKMFYDAMELFLNKHFNGSRPSLRLLSLRLGVRIHRSLNRLHLPYKKNKKKSGGPYRVCVKGDPDAQWPLLQMLAENKFAVSENEKDAEEIIYCEGPRQSWQSIMAEIIQNKNRYRYKFHGTATHAAVGSQSSREPGEVFEL